MNTICAISTAAGIGGVALIRVSGAEAVGIAGKVVGDLSHVEARRATFRRTDLDEMVVTVYRAPHSYTGEDTVEIACHGSQYIQQELLRRLTDAGCRLARGGEFTQRAFLNGKMDLTQAEAVADLIASRSRAEQSLALRQLKGGISNEMNVLRTRLLDLTSLLELELDFSDHEDVEFADRSTLMGLLDEIEQHILRLTDSFKAGNAIRNGISVAIVGPTNAGKSTLLNAILGEDRAIVSDIHGTTRDTVEEEKVIDGIRYRFIDTAGIRETSDTIEQLGIERSRQAIAKADIVVALDEPIEGAILVHNKCDLGPGAGIPICAKRGEIEPLITEISLRGRKYTEVQGDVLISNIRHYEALMQAKSSIEQVREGLTSGLSGELVAMDLHEILDAIGAITGQISNDEVLGNIFSKFCIGK